MGRSFNWGIDNANKNRQYQPTLHWRRAKEALTYAVRLVVSQLSNGIDLAEAVQFAAKYHDVTCAAIEAELSKKVSGTLSTGLSGL